MPTWTVEIGDPSGETETIEIGTPGIRGPIYDDIEIRADFAAADLATLDQAKAYADALGVDLSALIALAEESDDISDLVDAVAALAALPPEVTQAELDTEAAARAAGDSATLSSAATDATTKANAAQAAAATDATSKVATEATARATGDTNTLASAATDATTKANTAASGAASALATHEADTTSIHGIADTSVLETTTGAQTKATAAQAAAIAAAATDTTTKANAAQAASQPLDSDLTAFAAKTAPSGAVVGTTDTQTLTNKTLTTPAISSPTGLVKGDVALELADNTSDANKPVSIAQQAAIDAEIALRIAGDATKVGKGQLSFNVKDYGALGDMTAIATGNGTNDTTAINAAFTAASGAMALGLSPVVYFPQVAIGYRTTAGIVVPDNVSVQMYAPIIYDGAGGETALTIGRSGFRHNFMDHRVAVVRAALSSWASEADAGVEIQNHCYSLITIWRATDFTVDVNLWSNNELFQYNKVYLGNITNGKVALNLTSTGASRTIGQNKFYGGTFTIASSAYPTTDAVSVRITSTDALTVAHIGNKFYSPYFSLSDSGGGVGTGERIPALIEHGTHHTFYDITNISSPIAIRTKNAAAHNRMFSAYAGLAIAADDQGTYPTTKLTQGTTPILAESTRLIAQWSALHKKACYYDGGTKMHVPGLLTNTSSTTLADAMSNTGFTINPTYLAISTARMVGCYLDTSVVKRFAVVGDFESGFGGRLRVRPYDASGVVLLSSDAGYPHVKALSSASLTYSTSYGVSYASGSDSTVVPTSGRYFVVGPEVKSVFVGLSGGTQELRLRGFSIYTPDMGHCSTWLKDGHLTDDIANYGTAAPTAGTWDVGRTVINDAPGVGLPQGWRCTVAGTPGTWAAYADNASAVTLTNKRITRRAPTVTQSATPTINTDVTDVAHITGLAQAITSMTTNLTGTPVEGDTLRIDITDNGTARAITWGAKFEASTVALPLTTVLSTRMDIGFIWNTVTSCWRCVAVA